MTARSPDARPYIHADFMKTWRAMEALVDRKLVRHIGTSNMTVTKLKLVLRDARIKPAANEMELHPHFQQPELFRFVIDSGIQPVGYCPLGSPGRPERDRRRRHLPDGRPSHHGDRRTSRDPSGGCLHQMGGSAGPDADPVLCEPRNYTANLRAAAEDPLTDAEMTAIAGIDRNCRLIKGQVFLWRDGQSWEDLWDVDGEITPP